MAKVSSWIEAMRLRTLPVSVAGVITGVSCGLVSGNFKMVPSLICVVFALLAQITSNFANEYFDFRNGIDKPGRVGFRRGVTEGDISPRQMKISLFLLVALTCVVGLSVLFYAPLWFILVGIFVVIFAFAYSAGPYPLSHHGLGDLVVLLFFGVVPVVLTTFVQSCSFAGIEYSLPASLSVGLLAVNVLVVNNYRDVNDDAAVGKRTTVVIFGRRTMLSVYLLNGFFAVILMWNVWRAVLFSEGPIVFAVPLIFIICHVTTWWKIKHADGAALNKLLGKTARNLLLFTVLVLLIAILFYLYGKMPL